MVPEDARQLASYLAVQDGMKREHVEGIIRAGWAGIFLGGTDKFKRETAFQWCEMAHEFGLKFHYARAGTLRKLEHAKLIKADSLDSNFPLWTKARTERFVDQYFDTRQSRLALS